MDNQRNATTTTTTSPPEQPQAAPNMQCPMDNTELKEIIKGVFEACTKCGREWYYLGENLASKPRKVKLVRPLEEGVSLDDCIKPIKEEA